MKKAIAMKWVEALRSGKYNQDTGQLRSEDGFCCLGVLCNLHAQENPKFAAKQKDPSEYDGERSFPSEIVQKWAGLKSHNGYFVDNNIETDLAEENDEGASFFEIAEIIEKHYKQL